VHACSGLLCSVAQQAALDSDEAEREVLPRHNMIRSLLQGDTEDAICVTTVQGLRVSWQCAMPEGCFMVILDRNSLCDVPSHTVVAAGEPGELSRIILFRGYQEAFRAATRYIYVLSNQYGKQVSGDDVACFASLLCFRPGDHDLPITNKVGMAARELRWLSTTFANHFAMQSSLLKTEMRFHPCTTMTERIAFFSPPFRV
jgi:hypothetical protein